MTEIRSGEESNSYEAVIGLEVHCQLLTSSKAFSPEAAAFVREPNSQIDFVSLGYPGTLPVLNERVVECAVMLGLSTNCSIRSYSTLARKHYFYPDLPKGYQISQYEDPICYNGSIPVHDGVTGKLRDIRVKRIHIEEDAGKSIHDRSDEFTLLDYNRCGVPLCELVTEPDLRHPREAHEFVKSIRQIVRYLGICDGNMEEGSLRCDANISVRPTGSTELRTKTEIKNVNSLRHVEQALDFEFERQVAAYEAGKTIDQETMLWDPSAGETRVMRTKEMAHDYRYFPDPDLPPVVVSDDALDGIKRSLPELPNRRFQRFVDEFGLSEYDATLLADEKTLADFYENVVSNVAGHDLKTVAKSCANFVLTTVLGSSGPGNIASMVSPDRLGALMSMRLDNSLSSSATVKLFERLCQDDRDVLELAEEMNLLQVSDQSVLVPMVDSVLAEYPSQVEQYLGGKHGVIGFLIGNVMKMSKGAADPKLVREMMVNKLSQIEPGERDE